MLSRHISSSIPPTIVSCFICFHLPHCRHSCLPSLHADFPYLASYKSFLYCLYSQRSTSCASHVLTFPLRKVRTSAHIQPGLSLMFQLVDAHSADGSAASLHPKTHIRCFMKRRVASPSTGQSHVFRRCRQPCPYSSINDHHHIHSAVRLC